MFIKSLPTLLSSVLVLPCAYALQENSASIGINATVTSAHITISGGSGNACAPGQYWHIPDGKCRTAAFLRNVSAGTEAGVTSCDPGYTGSTNLRRDCTKPMYGWTSPDGEIFSYYGAKSCGAWYVTSSNCTADPPPSPPPSSPTTPTTPTTKTITIKAMICMETDSGYNDGGGLPALPKMYRDLIIKEYRSWGAGGRCPEKGGYDFYVNRLISYGTTYGTFGNGWKVMQKEMDAEAKNNDEYGQGGVDAANNICNTTAKSELGSLWTATYISGTGNQCTATSN